MLLPTAQATRPPVGIVDIKTNLPYADEAAYGTGVVLTGRGEVMTNNHVIRGAATIRVTDLDNGRTYAAAVVGYDVGADIAVLQLEKASALPTIKLAHAARARIGESVVGYGNAGGTGGAPSAAPGKVLGLGWTITALIDDGGTESLSGLIKVSSPLEPGDSGGPLIGAHGQTIGIDTAGSLLFRFDPTAAGFGFAIPINRASSIAAQIESGRSSPTVHVGATAFLGVNFQPSSLYSGLTPGLTVDSVVRGSPADKAGLHPGDLLTSLDDAQIATAAAFDANLLTKKPGDRLKLGWTDLTGGARTTTVTASSGPAQ
jgi:S1-C subfamily serine protease